MRRYSRYGMSANKRAPVEPDALADRPGDRVVARPADAGLGVRGEVGGGEPGHSLRRPDDAGAEPIGARRRARGVPVALRCGRRRSRAGPPGSARARAARGSPRTSGSSGPAPSGRRGRPASPRRPGRPPPRPGAREREPTRRPSSTGPSGSSGEMCGNDERILPVAAGRRSTARRYTSRAGRVATSRRTGVPRTVALLLDDPENHYQQLLVNAARPAAGRLRVDPPRARVRPGLLVDPGRVGEPAPARVPPRRRPRDAGRGAVDAGPVRADGQGRRGRGAPEPSPRLDGGASPGPPGPWWRASLPARRRSARSRARQALKLAPAGGFVLLVTGDASSPAAVARRRGFLEATAGRLAVHEVDGRWSVAGAEKAVGEWFRVGAERERPLALVVCQNDAMARGARAALAKQAADSGRRELGRTPLVGCDGMERGGKGDGRPRRARGDGRRASHDTVGPGGARPVLGLGIAVPGRSCSTPLPSRPSSRWAPASGPSSRRRRRARGRGRSRRRASTGTRRRPRCPRSRPSGRPGCGRGSAAAHRVGLQRRRVVGAHVAGGDRVHVDALARPLVGERLGELGDAPLGRRIGGDEDPALEGEQRGDVDDLAAAVGEHVAAGGPAHPEHRVEVDVEDREPVLVARLGGGRAPDRAGVVDDDVERTRGPGGASRTRRSGTSGR